MQSADCRGNEWTEKMVPLHYIGDATLRYLRTLVSVCSLGCRLIPRTRAFLTYVVARGLVWVARVFVHVWASVQVHERPALLILTCLLQAHLFRVLCLCADSVVCRVREDGDPWQKECTLRPGRLCNRPHSNMCTHWKIAWHFLKSTEGPFFVHSHSLKSVQATHFFTN